MRRNPLDLRGSTDPMCSGMTMRWLAHVLACTCMSDATLRAKQPTLSGQHVRLGP